MNNRFDELTKLMAQSTTRRAALKRFGVGLAGVALAGLGFNNEARAGNCKPQGSKCTSNAECCSGYCYFWPFPSKGNSKFGVCT